MISSRITLGVLAGAVGFVAAACAGSSAEIDFSRQEPTAPAATPVEPVPDLIRLAVGSVLSPVATSDLYAELAVYLARELDRPVELVQGQTYAETNDLVKSGDVTLALVCTNPFLQGQADFGMELLVAPEVNGETVYYSVLIAAAGSDAESLADLRGASFAFADPLSNSGRLAPLYQLALLGQSPDSFFSRTIFTYAHDSSIRAVAGGIVDAAAVDSLVWDYLREWEPDVAADVKVITRWGPYGINPVVVNPRLDPTLKSRLREVLLGMDGSVLGRTVLRDLAIDRFVVPQDGVYDSVREMRAFLRERGLGP